MSVVTASDLYDGDGDGDGDSDSDSDSDIDSDSDGDIDLRPRKEHDPRQPSLRWSSRATLGLFCEMKQRIVTISHS
ncbi:hypothetical protein [Pseudomonas petrae]|uniref:hypothetical protein n=1 Tax=Pseudomonas petrae TaxID=2912190 RepID=UPI001F21B7E1|nr:hypothetical protein [Pseudomonas petrae]MCF7536652.1 hypothetical protein [Pseudomonas petrae]